MQTNPPHISVQLVGEQNIQVIDKLKLWLDGAGIDTGDYGYFFDKLSAISLPFMIALNVFTLKEVYSQINNSTSNRIVRRIIGDTAIYVDFRPIIKILKQLRVTEEILKDGDNTFRSKTHVPILSTEVARFICETYARDSILAKNKEELVQLKKEVEEIKVASRAATVAHTAALQEINLLNARAAALLNAHNAEWKTQFQQKSEIGSIQIDAGKAEARAKYFQEIARAEKTRKDYEIEYINALSELKLSGLEYENQLSRMNYASSTIDSLVLQLPQLNNVNERQFPVIVEDDPFAELERTAENMFDRYQQHHHQNVDDVNDIRNKMDGLNAKLEMYKGYLGMQNKTMVTFEEIERLAKELDRGYTEFFADVHPTVYLTVTQKELVKAAVEPLVKLQQNLNGYRSVVLNKIYEAQLIKSALDASIAEMHVKITKIRMWLAKWRSAQLMNGPRERHVRCTYRRDPNNGNNNNNNNYGGMVECGFVGDLFSAVLWEARNARGTVTVYCCAMHHEMLESRFRDNIYQEIMESVVVVGGERVFKWCCQLRNVITN